MSTSKKSTSNKEHALRALQSLKEDDFTKIMLLPLLSQMGYADIEFHGGSYEEGKDFIAFSKNCFDEYDVFVGQVKKFKASRNFEKRKQFAEIIYQLQQCRAKRIPCKDGLLRGARDIAFVTPYPLEIRIIEEQFESLCPGPIPIRIIDGNRLYELLTKHCPALINELMGLDGKISSCDPYQLMNSELLNALSVDQNSDYSDFYSDLSFFVGSIDSNMLLNCKISFSGEIISLESGSWVPAKKVINIANKKAGFNLLTRSESDVEKAYKEEYKQFTSKENTKRIKDRDKIAAEFSDVVGQINKALREIRTDISSIRDNQKLLTASKIDEDELDDFDGACIEASLVLATIAIQNCENALLSRVTGALDFGADTALSTRFQKDANNVNIYSKKLMSLAEQYRKILSHIINEPKYHISFSCEENEKWFEGEFSWYLEAIYKLNSNKFTLSEIRQFIARVERLLGIIDVLVSRHADLSSHITIVQDAKRPDRLHISAHSIIDSGCNIAIYGEAGAGKTTTLQMYARRFFESCSENEILLYLPLNRVAVKWIATKQNDDVGNDIDELSLLYRAILIYKDLEPSPQNIRDLDDFLRSKSRILFILDGLDEAFKDLSWIFKAISKANQNYSSLQIVVSSRDCVNYMRDIEFLGITLLPFNDAQLKQFVRGWLTDERIADSLLSEIERNELFEVAKNPLLATIICSLAENGIEVPRSEPDVYRKRIELLCGSYDKFKSIKRVESAPNILELACRKIAYALHSRRLREAPIDLIVDYFYSAVIDKMSKETASKVVEELINPCNILKSIPSAGTYGFGHLRFQEMLVADELIHNRGIEITPFLGQDWWYGVLYLYAFDNRLDSVIDDAYQKMGSLTKYQTALRKMLKARPAGERADLIRILNGHQKQDEFDRDYVDPDEYGHGIFAGGSW